MWGGGAGPLSIQGRKRGKKTQTHKLLGTARHTSKYSILLSSYYYSTSNDKKLLISYSSPIPNCTALYHIIQPCKILHCTKYVIISPPLHNAYIEQLYSSVYKKNKKSNKLKPLSSGQNYFLRLFFIGLFRLSDYFKNYLGF